jgi:hypothetical protein
MLSKAATNLQQQQTTRNFPIQGGLSPIDLLIGSLSTMSSAQLTACLRNLARHFKTDHTDTEPVLLQ